MTAFAKVSLLSVSLFVALALIPGSAYAALIAQDSFDFGVAGAYIASPAGRNVVAPSPDGKTRSATGTAQNPSSPVGFTGGAPGGAGAWQGANTSLWQVQDVGLSYTGQPSSGGSVQYDWNSSLSTRMQSRALSAPPTVTLGDEYWISGMVSYNALETDNVGAAYIGFGDTSTGSGVDGATAGTAFFNENPNGLRFGLQATGSGGKMDLVLRYQDTADAVATGFLATAIAPATTQLVFLKAEVGAAAGDDLISVWVNPTLFGNEIELGAADFTFVGSAFDSATALNLLLLQGFDIDNTSGGGGVRFDEIMLGTTFFDVAPNATPLVPEPSTFLLFGLGALGLVRRTRRRGRNA